MKITLTSIVVVAVALYTITGRAAPTETSPTTTVEDFILVPPGPVTQASLVEARVVLRNASGSAVPVTAKLLATNQETRVVGAADVLVRPFDVKVAPMRVDVKGLIGRHTLSIALCVGDQSITAPVKKHVLLVLSRPEHGRALPLPQMAWLGSFALLPSNVPRMDKAGNVRVDRSIVGVFLKGLAEIGVTTILIHHVESRGIYFYPSKEHFFDCDVGRRTRYWGELGDPRIKAFDVVEETLSKADELGMHVFVSVGRSGDKQLLPHLVAGREEPLHGRRLGERLAFAIDMAQRKAREMWRLYGHHPSFYGWYLSHETANLRVGKQYYNPVASELQRLSPGKPIALAPASIVAIAGRSDFPEILRAYVPDVFLYQDGVGIGWEDRCGVRVQTHDPSRRLEALDAYYRHVRRWHDAANAGRTGGFRHAWADVEIWRRPAPDEGSRPAPYDEVARQLDREAAHVDFISIYEAYQDLDPEGSPFQIADVVRNVEGYGAMAWALFAALRCRYARERGSSTEWVGADTRKNW